jgi:hypothetical protein
MTANIRVLFSLTYMSEGILHTPCDLVILHVSHSHLRTE